jgi:hypothetical protein
MRKFPQLFVCWTAQRLKSSEGQEQPVSQVGTLTCRAFKHQCHTDQHRRLHKMNMRCAHTLTRGAINCSPISNCGIVHHSSFIDFSDCTTFTAGAAPVAFSLHACMLEVPQSPTVTHWSIPTSIDRVSLPLCRLDRLIDRHACLSHLHTPTKATGMRGERANTRLDLVLVAATVGMYARTHAHAHAHSHVHRHALQSLVSTLWPSLLRFLFVTWRRPLCKRSEW